MKKIVIFLAAITLIAATATAQTIGHNPDCTPQRGHFFQPAPWQYEPVHELHFPQPQPVTVTVNINRSQDSLGRDFWLPLLLLLLFAGIILFAIALFRMVPKSAGGNSVTENHIYHHYDDKEKGAVASSSNPGWPPIPEKELEFLKTTGHTVFYHRTADWVKIDIKTPKTATPVVENKEALQE